MTHGIKANKISRNRKNIWNLNHAKQESENIRYLGLIIHKDREIADDITHRIKVG